MSDIVHQNNIENLEEIVHYMNRRTPRLLEYVILNFKDQKIVRKTIECVISSSDMTPLSLFKTNNYILLWIDIHHNDLYQKLLSTKGKAFKKELPHSRETEHLKEIFKIINLKHECYVKKDNFLVAEFIIGDIIFTKDLLHNSVKNMVLKELYPKKKVVLYSLKNELRIDSVDKIKEFLTRYNLINRDFTQEEIAKLEAFLKQNHLNPDSEEETENTSSEETEFSSDDIISPEGIDYEN